MPIFNVHDLFMQTLDILLPSLYQNFWPWLPILIASAACIYLLTGLVGKLAYVCGTIIGESHKEALKREKTTKKFMDVFSWLHNIFGK